MTIESLPSIPLVDIRHTGPIALVQEYEGQTRALLKAARRAFGPLGELAAHIALPLADKMVQHWLAKTDNPYLPQIRAIADMLKTPGVYALNLSYEWGCTTSLQASDGGCLMLRTLDWPFPDMGRHLIVTHEQGRAGDYYNLTWPGLVGVFTAMAPSRFAIAINQAPMRSPAGYLAIDWLMNRLRLGHERGLPPAHLLRHVMEHAESFDKAVEMLTHTPLCMPAIFTISGIREQEGLIIERQERAAYMRPIQRGAICTANHWVVTPTAKRWVPREPDSYGRKGTMEEELKEQQGSHFEWLQPPVMNGYTRVACMMNAQTGQLSAVGIDDSEIVTEILSI